MLPIAKILKSNGVDGDLLAGLIDINYGEIDTTEPVFVEFDGLPVPFFIERITPKGGSRAIIHLTDVDSLRDAEEMVGRQLCLEGDEEEEEFEDFCGWTLMDKDRTVGVITDLEDIPGNPCLCVGDTLVPLHEDFILSADPERRILVMDLPEGLV